MVTVGGLRGVELDLALNTGWTASCPFANGVPTVPLFVGGDGNLRWVAAGNERLRLSLLDVPGGGTVVVDIDAFDGTLFDELLVAATPIVQSLEFATPDRPRAGAPAGPRGAGRARRGEVRPGVGRRGETLPCARPLHEHLAGCEPGMTVVAGRRRADGVVGRSGVRP